MIRLFLMAGILMLLSCTVQKGGGKLNDKEGHIYYEHPSPQMSVQLYGDYKFHSIKRKHFSDVDKSFLKYTTSKAHRTAPRLMYAAHTFVKPFYSTIGVLYKKAQVNENLLANIKQQIQQNLKTTYNGVDSFYTNMGTAYYFSYDVVHRESGDTTAHREYLINHQNDLIRYYFWTDKSDTAVVFREAELILKNIR